jgi:hypothetical protein
MIRREFIKQALIASSAVLASHPIAGTKSFSLVRSRGNRISAVVYDERYSDCRIFATALQHQGAVVFATAGEAARVWYTSLRSHSARHGGCVAGITTDADRGVSQIAGRELKLRLVYEGLHDGRGSILHHHSGIALNNATPADFEGNTRWAESLAEFLLRTTNPEVHARGNYSDGASLRWVSPKSEDYPGYLTSWLLAPVR